ncbi:MAG: hydrogenase expression/formation protein [Chloroflexi bacterium]|nr:hydrogenase expression/formation protein [Chloroflexota bacterium]
MCLCYHQDTPLRRPHLRVGKLPAELLQKLLAQVPALDPRVLVGARFGEDAALIDYGDRVLVAKSDPVTFATDRLGWYVVQVNANDVAVMGATPRWFLCTLLLPEGAPEAQAEDLFRQLLEACRELGVSLVGGHTEVTYGLRRPIAAGFMLGEVERGKQVLTSGAQAGDALILTKGIAIEGTALLARDAAGALRERGVAPETIERAATLLFQPGISVVRDARLACQAGGVHAMHDPTEGGLATGLHELASAAGVGLEVDAASIAVLPETAEVCRALGLDPMGLLASGALIAAVVPGSADLVVRALRDQGIPSAVIGRVVEAERGVVLHTPAGPRPLPSFPRDELARFFEETRQP